MCVLKANNGPSLPLSLPPPPMSTPFLLLRFLLLLSTAIAAAATTTTTTTTTTRTRSGRLRFKEAPQFYNSPGCPTVNESTSSFECSPDVVHVAMTLDSAYLRGSMAAILSVLQHSSCPQNIQFHFITPAAAAATAAALRSAISHSFPYLRFSTYPFRSSTVLGLISTSIRTALDSPLNYARNYLPRLLPPCLHRAVYLDSDVILVDDIASLSSTPLGPDPSTVLAAPEYCNANFTSYFTPTFWSNPALSLTFSSDRRARRPCYFNTGVMVIDLHRWRRRDYTKRIEEWMELQKRLRIYELGSLPPFLLVFAANLRGGNDNISRYKTHGSSLSALGYGHIQILMYNMRSHTKGNIAPVDHRWNQHGLGGDNFRGLCRDLHPGPVSLLHWSGKGKPWARLDANRPCPLDALWAPYDLLETQSTALDQ